MLLTHQLLCTAVILVLSLSDTHSHHFATPCDLSRIISKCKIVFTDYLVWKLLRDWGVPPL